MAGDPCSLFFCFGTESLRLGISLMLRPRFGMCAVALFALCLDCNKKNPPDPSASSSPSSSPSGAGPATSPLPAVPRITATSGDIALNNLEAQISRLELRLAKAIPQAKASAETLDDTLELVELLLTRAEFLGRIADMERALVLSEEQCAQSPKEARALYARARARASFHRFSEALLDLEEAQKLGMRPDWIERRRASIWAAEGRYDDALPLLSKAALEMPSLDSLGALAVLMGDMGRLEEANHFFEEALAVYRDTSPFPVAWIFFQQGLLWERNEKIPLARAYFGAAAEKLPRYAHALSHLASYLPYEQGRRALELVMERSDDPEYQGQLAELLRRMGKTGEAGEQLAQAKARFLTITEQYPEAFADHGARFFLYRSVDKAKALQLARLGAARRKTEMALDLWLSAALSADAEQDACDAAAQGLKLRYASPAFRQMAEKVGTQCKP